MYKKCIICESSYDNIILNYIPMRKCISCGLIWQKNIKNKNNYYKRIGIDLSNIKIQSRINNCLDRFRTIKRYVNLNNLCDVGCGDGIFLKILKDHGYKNLVGIEPSINAREFINKNKLNVKEGFLEDVNNIFASYKINTITMFHVIEHLTNPIKSLKLINKCLKRKDIIIIETPNINAYSFKRTNYNHKLIYKDHLFYFNIKNLKQILNKSGFKVIVYGKRDFDQYNLSIRESLFRLGLIKKVSYSTCQISKVKTLNIKSRNNYFKNIIRYFLSRVVIILGRLDYIWLVAEKNSIIK